MDTLTPIQKEEEKEVFEEIAAPMPTPPFSQSENFEMMIPLVGMLGSFVMTTIIAVAVLRAMTQKRELLSREIIAAIEKGQDLPVPAPKERNYRNLGFIWTFVGIALTLLLWFSERTLEAAAWGLLPLALGIAFLLIHRTEDKGGEESQVG